MISVTTGRASDLKESPTMRDIRKAIGCTLVFLYWEVRQHYLRVCRAYHRLTLALQTYACFSCLQRLSAIASKFCRTSSGVRGYWSGFFWLRMTNFAAAIGPSRSGRFNCTRLESILVCKVRLSISDLLADIRMWTEMIVCTTWSAKPYDQKGKDV